MISVCMLSYNRPAFLRQAVSSLFRNAGEIDFEFLLWDNGSNEETGAVVRELAGEYPIQIFLNNENIGQQAFHYLAKQSKGDLFVLVEDDMIWFQEDWLYNLYKAFTNPPTITDKGKELGFKSEWGIVATNVLVDKVNNGGMWRSRFSSVMDFKKNGIRYWTNVQAGAGAMIFKKSVIEELNIFPKECPKFGQVNRILKLMDDNRYLMAHARDVYIYHAASPYWNELYKQVWYEKQNEDIEESKDKYLALADFDFGDTDPKRMLLNGNFNLYAQKLCEEVIHKDIPSWQIVENNGVMI